MLSDEDKAEVIENKANYSLDEIEAKLSVICVRKKVSFDLEDENKEEQPITTFSLGNIENEAVPAWISACKNIQSKKQIIKGGYKNMATIKRIGFGQVEPNHLSAQRTGQIYAQLPANKDIKVLENGQFVKYDYANNEVNFTGEGEWMLVFNEVKLYDDAWRESYKDFALQTVNFTEGVMTPRLFKTNVGDIYTTNCVGAANVSGKSRIRWNRTC